MSFHSDPLGSKEYRQNIETSQQGLTPLLQDSKTTAPLLQGISDLEDSALRTYVKWQPVPM